VNGYDTLDFMKNKKDIYNRTGIYELFTSLISRGGTGQWSVSREGQKHDFGIEIPFRCFK
jgi:hypothetical protein